MRVGRQFDSFPGWRQRPALGAFRGYRNSALSLPAGAATTIVFNEETFDVSGWFDKTAGTFKPRLAGVYDLRSVVTYNDAAFAVGKELYIALAKNGGDIAYGNDLKTVAGQPVYAMIVFDTVVANGSTDTFSINVYNGDTAARALAWGESQCYFQGTYLGHV